MSRPTSRSTRRTRASLGAGLLAVVVAAPLALTPAVAADSPRAAGTDNARSVPPLTWREGFDSVEPDLLPRSEDPGIEDGTIGWTHEGPQGWSVETDASMEGIGVEEWRGWSFTTRDFWTDAEDQMRDRFGRAQGVIAVADSDEFDDAASGPHTFDTTLVSPSVRVHRQQNLTLSFDTHYRQWTGQQATVTVEFDGDGEQHELMRYDGDTATNDYDQALVNANEELAFEVPEGAKRAVFRWRFVSERNSWYWAIDSVHLRHTLPSIADTADPTQLWVVSDIQGHPGDFSHGIEDMHDVRPDADALLIVGDLVNSGAAWEWDEMYDVMDERSELLPDPVIASIGNHERYAAGGWPLLRQRFLDFAERDEVWGEYLVDGGEVDVPVLTIGQDAAGPTDVPISDEQMAWFTERLEYWTAQRKQVVVSTHFPLGDTVSASWIPWYHNHHERNDELTELLGSYPNVVVLTGHTHYPMELGDWAVQRRTEGGHPDGFRAVNTGAMHVEWDARGENIDGISEVVTRDINRGLTIDAYRDRLVVNARDYGVPDENGTNDVNEVLREVQIPNPFVRR